MRKNNKKTNPPRRFALRALTAVLVLVMLAQSMAFSIAAAVSEFDWTFGGSSFSPVSGIVNFDSDEVIDALKKDLFKSFNQDLIKRVEDYELSGPVDVIVTFSDDSIVSVFTESEDSQKMSLQEFRTTSKAAKLEREMLVHQNGILNKLFDDGVIDQVNYNYVNIMDGACVSTTYEKLSALCNAEGIERVMISNSYEPMAAVENPVDVYDTGIFNSSSVSYTGKGTIVAVLDTGCDYNHSAFNTYEVDSPLYDRDEIEALLEGTKAYGYNENLEVREVYYGNITGNKIAFGYDYADKDPDIMPFDNYHGTHVAGIIAGKDDTITGVAIDAQLAIMKVFSDYKQGADSDDILAALEDSIILGVDAINMSLGTSCGFTREVDELYKNEIYDNIEKAGISLVVAASNDYSSAYGSENGNTNKTDNPDSATVGAPSTYDAAMSVASINGNKDKYMLANGDKVVFYLDAYDMAAEEYDFFEMLGIKAGEKVTYEYVTIPGNGLAINYSGLDVKGKIALVKRGDISFEEKVQFAQEAGAIAIVIYNNVFGDIRMTIGNYAKIPAVSIGKDDGDVLAARESGTIEFDLANVAGPFMSDFSSWGPTPDLKLKPEITAHGGNIYSAVLGNEYDKASGTSMAAPNMCGITVLIRQYVKEKYPDLSAPAVRDLVNQLTMSTATIALDKNGNPYSPRKQGAGIADIAKSTTTSAYLSVDGIGKTKLELGHDPQRLGVYTMTLNVNNISDSAISYRIGNITMTESISTSEPEYVAELAYLLSPDAVYSVEGGTLSDGVLTVEGGKSAKVTVELTLSKADKTYLNSTFANGMFVEGFITFDNMEENGVDLNAPFLAFYGDWGEAPIFDLDYYEVETEAHDNSIDDEDKIKADYYATTPLGSYYYDYIIPLGTYLYEMDETEYTPIPATRDRAAVSYYLTSMSGIYGVFTGLLRGAKEMTTTIVDTSTGKVVWEQTEYNCYKSHFSGQPIPYASKMDVPMVDLESGQVFGMNNVKYEVTMSAKLDWDGGDNDSDTFSFSFYIDYQPPSVVDATYRTEYDKSSEENRYYLDLIVYDNHYAMSCRPIVLYEFYDEHDGEMKKSYTSLSDNPVPIYQEERNSTSKVSIEITDYIDIIADTDAPNGVTIYLDDYAMNASIAYIPFPETDSEDLEFAENEINLDINQTVDLTTLFVHKDSADPVESDYLKTLKWEIESGNDVIFLKNGQIEALKSGTAVIKVTSDSWVTPTKTGGEWVNKPIYKTLIVNVSDKVMTDNPLSSENVLIEELKFTSYDTLFAFTGDIDFSEIGRTDTTNYFGNNYSLAFYPSEKIKLNYQIDPWNLPKDRYELIWSSSNPKVATVDENGVVTGESEGKARITLQIKIDGKTSLLAARLSVEIKSEFIIENRTLVAYKGKGGEVVIPDDEGIMTIGAFAFSHFYLDNEREVEKDEDGYYDLDLKKDALGNDTVTSVVVPENVQTIEKYAFYNCNALENVTLPSTCENIKAYAFAGCEKLKNVNFDDVKIIFDYAFQDCESLSCEDLGGAAFESVYAIGDYAFSNTKLETAKLLGLSRIGVGVFSDCSALKEVELGKGTRVSAKMFKNTSVESIVVYGDMIDDSAFEGCTSLKSVTIKNDVTYVGNSAFKGCTALEEFVAEGVVEQIGSYAFYGCGELENITLPNSEIAIGDSVFAKTGLKTVKFGEKTQLITVGTTLFEGLSTVAVNVDDSEYYKLVDGSIFSKDGKTLVFVLPAPSLKAYVVPKEVTAIGDGAFSSVSTIAEVSFENGSNLSSIGDNAFANCALLSSIILPDRSVTIGDRSFLETVSLSSINLNKVTSVGDYAFSGSAVKSVDLSAEKVTVGNSAFANCTRLSTVKLGAGAVIGDHAFSNSSVSKVELLGDTTVGAYSFANCLSLVDFSFEKLVGKIGDYAFNNCQQISAVVIPNVVEIGQNAFSDCYAISTFSAKSLKVIGDNCFRPYGRYATYANHLVSVDMPVLETIGADAFYGCVYLKSIDISSVTSIGKEAFYACEALDTVVLSKDLKEIPDYAFVACTHLKNIDLSNVERIGYAAFYNATLPEELKLDNVVYIDELAFLYAANTSPLKSVVAPKLTELGTQAFVGHKNLESFSAPKLESIGYIALGYSAIKEFEITSAMKDFSPMVFEGCENFEAFYATVDGQKVYDADLGGVLIKDGVLYTAMPDGYILSCYPVAKDDSTVTVADGTLRIEAYAFYNNKSLEKVILPASLKTISNYAFYECKKLKTVEFNSYYAPVLEGSMTSAAVDVTPDNINDYPYFDNLYRYDYTYMFENELGTPLYYANFKGIIGSKNALGMTAVLPENCTGYDTPIYTTFFTISDETTGVTAGKYAVDFIDAVRKLPEVCDRFDELVIFDAIVAYNALQGHSEELVYVDEATIARYNKAYSEYSIDVVEDKIAHLFDMDNTKYSYDLVKDANASFLALTAEEQGRVTNKDVLTSKIAELEEELGMKLDFSKTYEELFAPGDPPPAVVGDDDLETWVIILIVVLSVVVVAGAALLTIILVKKKRVSQ